MAATAATAEETLEVTWRDPKRYLWLLGLIVPLLPFIAWGLAELTGLGIFWWFGPFVVFGVDPVPRHGDRQGLRRTRPTRRPQVPRAGPLLPLVHLPVPAAAVRVAGLRVRAVVERRPLVPREPRPRVHRRRWSAGSRSTPPTSSATSARARALAREGRARPDRLRPLLHRAQPRPSRPRRHARGPGQLAPRRELLGVLAAHRRSAACARALRARAVAPRRGVGSRSARIHNDILNAWAMTVVLFAALDRRLRHRACCPGCSIQAVVGFSLLEVVNYLEHYGLLRQARGRRPLRALRARAQLELQQHRLQRLPLPPAAPLRPPRQPGPPLPGAAPLRRGAGAALGLRDDDRARLRARRCGAASWIRSVLAHYGGDVTRANVHPRKREQAIGPLRGGRYAGEPAHGATAIVPRLRLHLRRGGGRPARGLPARDAVGGDPRRLVLPRLRRPREGRLRAGRSGAEPPPYERPAAATAGYARERRCWGDRSSTRSASCSPTTPGARYDGRGRRPRRRQPPDPLQRVRLRRRARAGLRPARGRRDAGDGRRRGGRGSPRSARRDRGGLRVFLEPRARATRCWSLSRQPRRQRRAR